MPVRVGLKVIELWNSSMEDQVCEYEKEPIETGKIVFYGPSYFTRWSEKWKMIPLKEAVKGKSGAQCCINRGFGSSCEEHHVYYYGRMVRPLAPKVLVYAPYGNGPCFGYTDDECFELAQRVVAYTRAEFPDTHIYICSPCPTKATTPEKFAQKELHGEKLKKFAKETPNCFYLDWLHHEPLHNPDLFVQDGVHFNQDGFNVFAEFFKEALKDELAKF